MYGSHLYLFLQRLPNLTSPYPGSGSVHYGISRLYSFRLNTLMGIHPYSLLRLQKLPNLTSPYPGTSQVYSCKPGLGSVYSCIGKHHSLNIHIIGIHPDSILPQKNLTSPYPGSGQVYHCISRLHPLRIYIQLGKAQPLGLRRLKVAQVDKFLRISPVGEMLGNHDWMS